MPTVFLSAATVDLEEWRNLLHKAFSRAGFHVYTQAHSLSAALGNVRRLLTDHIDESQCVIHLAGQGYGSDADPLDPKHPDFHCSWTQFEYYYAHQQGKDVIAFVCAPNLSKPGFKEDGTAADIARKARLQDEHCKRVASGKFDGTPLAGKVGRASNEHVDSVQSLLTAVAAAVGALHKLGDGGKAVSAELEVLKSFHQLPLRPAGFVGRETDLATLRKQNPAAGAVLTGLRGMGGIGKTALGLVLAYEWTAQFPDAQIFLDARGTQANPPSGGDLLAQVIQTFHPTAKLPDDLAALQAIYNQVLTGKRVLIFLDNAKDAAQAKPLIPPPGCGYIVTSRHHFMLGATRPYDVGKLPAIEAGELLREYYPALNAADTAELVRLCAGLPLALRLAGSHLALDGDTPNVAGYIRALGSGRLKTLDAEAADAGEITISETLRVSEAQLSAVERTAWRALGIFTASFDARAAQVIAAADEATLTILVRRSLLEREGTERYKLHDLAADYAREQLGLNAETDLHLAHARHFTAVGEDAENLYLNGDVVSGLALFDRERVQIEDAFTWLAVCGDEVAEQQLCRLVFVVAFCSDLRFHPRQRIAWLENQLRAARSVKDKHCEGAALCNLGLAHGDLGNMRKAIEYYEQTLTVSHAIGDRQMEGNALGNLGLAHAAMGDTRKAIGFHEQSLKISRDIGYQRGERCSLGNLGSAHAKLGDTGKAISYHEQALGKFREMGDRRGEGTVLLNIGNVHFRLRDARKAIEFYEMSLVVARETGDRHEQGNVLFNSALAHDSLGKCPEAIARAMAALVIYEAIESPHAAKVRAQLAEWK